MERHGLGKVLFASTKEQRAEQGLMLKRGTVMDDSILAAPTWRKNRRGEGDLEMEQSKKGNQWHFDMKLPMGGDDQSGLVQSLATTAANVHDLVPSQDLL
ncbi:MAG: hypothetical protein OXI08_03845 [Cyanobacteria bacterium MAG IRC4_bin_6]|nr:hypothetical protein [Cyanobacteria bacterium MAG IRC4_bin_6]MXY18497.1 hypothetical protein [Synechococcus sp. SB0664_bin_36]